MNTKYQLDLSSIDKQKLHIELSHYCHTNYTNKDEAKAKISSLSNLLYGEPDKITKDNPLYGLFIGYYLSHFDKRLVEIISHFGTYRRNGAFIEIYLNEDESENNILIEMNVGLMGKTTDKSEMSKEIKNLFNYLSTIHIPYERKVF